MKDGWVEKVLGEFFETVTGGTPPKKEKHLYGDFIPFVKPPELRDGQINSASDNLSREGADVARVLPINSILVSCIGNLGKIGINDVPVAFNQQINAIKPRSEIAEPRFMFYQTLSPMFVTNLERRASGTTVPIVNKSKFNSIPIVLPPLPEQKRIVTILDEAFEGIAAAVANAEKNLANARELFENYLNFRLLSVASSKPTQTFSCITDLIVDCEHKTAPVQDTGFPSIRTPNIGKGKLILDGVNRVSEETYKLWTMRGEPKHGDLILAREAPAGNICIIPEGEKVCLGQRTVLIRPKEEIVNSQYLAFLILHPIMQKRLLSYSTGATVQHVNMKDIRKLAMSHLPPINEQISDVQSLETAQSKIARLEDIYQKKLTALAELKQSLLQKAFAGELTAEGTVIKKEAVA